MLYEAELSLSLVFVRRQDNFQLVSVPVCSVFKAFSTSISYLSGQQFQFECLACARLSQSRVSLGCFNLDLQLIYSINDEEMQRDEIRIDARLTSEALLFYL